jgi:hypothetical protein
MLAAMLRPLLAAAVLLVAAGCSGDEPEPAPTPTRAPLSALDTASVVVVRGELCTRLADASVEAALGGPAAAADAYGNGDTAELADGVRDVAHEYGCAWTGADGTTARAWVLAPPVTAGRANRLQAAATRADGCEPLPDAPRFGARSAAVRCADDGAVVASYRGLFGDAWLSCSLRAPDAAAADLPDRATTWCTDVLHAASATP